MSKKQEFQIISLREFSVADFLKYLYSRIRKIILITSSVLVLGIIIAFTSPYEYMSSAFFLPESQESSADMSSSLAGLAGLAGIDLQEMSAEGGVSPLIYPQIIASTNFMLKLMGQEYYFEELDSTVSIYTYFTKYQNVGLLQWIAELPKKWIRSILGGREYKTYDVEFVYLNEDQVEVIEELRTRVLLSVDMETNIITITCTMQDPVVAARVAQFTLDYVSNYITEYYISKERLNLEFVRQRTEEAKREFEKVQTDLAEFRDKNKAIGLEVVKIEENRLESEYNIKFNVYNGLAQSLEQSKIAVQEKTPVYTILEPVMIPYEESEPAKPVIIIFSFIVGVFFSTLYYLYRFVIKLDK